MEDKRDPRRFQLRDSANHFSYVTRNSGATWAQPRQHGQSVHLLQQQQHSLYHIPQPSTGTYCYVKQACFKALQYHTIFSFPKDYRRRTALENKHGTLIQSKQISNNILISSLLVVLGNVQNTKSLIALLL